MKETSGELRRPSDNPANVPLVRCSYHPEMKLRTQSAFYDKLYRPASYMDVAAIALQAHIGNRIRYMGASVPWVYTTFDAVCVHLLAVAATHSGADVLCAIRPARAIGQQRALLTNSASAHHSPHAVPFGGAQIRIQTTERHQSFTIVLSRGQRVIGIALTVLVKDPVCSR